MTLKTIQKAGMMSVALLLAGGTFGDDLAPFPKWSAPRRVTEGPHDHLFASYFAIDSWSPNKRYISVLETDLNGRLPEAGERCTLGLVDLEDGNRFIPVTTTACWNFQEATMAHWMNDDEIIFNDLRDGKFVAVVMNWKRRRSAYSRCRFPPFPKTAHWRYPSTMHAFRLRVPTMAMQGLGRMRAPTRYGRRTMGSGPWI